jgi:hypothetical protein
MNSLSLLLIRKLAGGKQARKYGLGQKDAGLVD